MSANAAETYNGGVYRLTARAEPPADGAVEERAAKRPRAHEPLSPEALAAWHVLRDEGGFWTSAELGRQMLPDAPLVRANVSGGRWMSALIKRGHVALQPSFRRVKAYGVTARCIPPAGESLEPVDKPQIQGVEQ
jgi:hypothetical protein